MNRHIVICGAQGQLGYELQRTVPEGIQITALDRTGLNLADTATIAPLIERLQPGGLINAAAYTAVDKAETETATAHRVNAVAAGALAQVCRLNGIRLVHVSTDFVFDGRAAEPYPVDAPPNPLSQYGNSKAAGEQQVAAAIDNYAIVRTAWLYSAHGSNFVKTMLRLLASKPELAVVADQTGSPTWAKDLAVCCWQLVLDSSARGMFHYTGGGYCSWYEFAVEIQRQAMALGLLKKTIPISRITTADYPTAAARPAYSVLDSQRYTNHFHAGLPPLAAVAGSDAERIIMKALLVTGGAGFIGANFVLHWLAQYPQHRVVVLDALNVCGQQSQPECCCRQPRLRIRSR